MLPGRALLVAINAYHPLIGRLAGCLNDAIQLKEILRQRFDFPAAETRELFNTAACRTAILNGLDWLVEDAQPGDVRVFFYSGHGTRLPNPLDPSGKDEALVAFSPRWETLLAGETDPSLLFLEENQRLQFIRDKEIKARLTHVAKDVNLTLVVDCCYSGDINREPTMNPRYLEPPSTIQTAIQEATRFYWEHAEASSNGSGAEELKIDAAQAWRLLHKVALGNRFDLVNTQESGILLAACSEKETALEKSYKGQMGGVFTHSLLEVLGKPGPVGTYDALIRELGYRMRFIPQTPRLACPSRYRSETIFTSFNTSR